MKKLIGILAALLFAGSLSFAQTTAVTATVVDTDGTAWANNSWKIQFVPNPSQPNIGVYNINGVPLTPAQITQTGVSDSSGVLSATVLTNSTISPSGSSWTLQVCPEANSKCGSIAFTATGGTLNLSSALTAEIPAPRFSATAGSYGYADIEAINQLIPGSTYYNVILQSQRYWFNGVWSSGALPSGIICVGSGTAQVCTFPGTVIANVLIANSAAYGPTPPTGAAATNFLGNSITSGGDNGPTSSFPKEIHLLTNTPEGNFGIGGQRSGDIATRWNAYAGQPQQQFPAGFIIPTSGSVDITFVPGYEPAFNLNARLNKYPATGVPIQFTIGSTTYSGGVLVDTGTIPTFTYAFTPFVYPSSPVSVPSGTAWIVQVPDGTFNGCSGVEAGENNFSNAAQVEADVAAVVAVMASHNPCWVVMPILNTNAPSGWAGNSGYIASQAINSYWASLYGTHYFDMRSFLVSQYNPADAVDVIDHGHDVPPSSLKKNNQLTGTLVAAISDTTTLAITFGTNIPANNSVTVNVEKILITGGTDGSYTGTRGYLGTTAATHAIGASWVAAGTLRANVSDTTTCAITLGSTIGPGSTVTLDTERIYITSGSDGAYTCTRGWGSTAATHTSGAEWEAIDPLHPGSNNYSAANPNFQNGNAAIASYYVNTWLLNNSQTNLVSLAYLNYLNVARNHQPIIAHTLALDNNDNGALWGVTGGWYFHGLTELWGCSLDESCKLSLGDPSKSGFGNININGYSTGTSFKTWDGGFKGTQGVEYGQLGMQDHLSSGTIHFTNDHTGNVAFNVGINVPGSPHLIGATGSDGSQIVNSTPASKTAGDPGCWNANGDLVESGANCPNSSSGGSGYPTTTAIVIADSSIYLDDSHATSTVLTPGAWDCGITTVGVCTVNTTTPHNLTTSSYVNMTGLTGWFAPPAGLNAYDTGYGSFPVASIISSTRFTVAYSLNTGSGTGGTLYDASWWGTYAISQEPFIKGHGTIYYRFGSCADLTTNFAANFGSITGTPKIMVLGGCLNDVIAMTSISSGVTSLEGTIYPGLWTAAHSAGWFVYQMGELSTNWGIGGACNINSPLTVCDGITDEINTWLPSQKKSFFNASSGAYYDAYITMESNWGAGTAAILGNGVVGGQNFADRLNNAFADQGSSTPGPQPVWHSSSNGTRFYGGSSSNVGSSFAVYDFTQSLQISADFFGVYLKSAKVNSLAGTGTRCVSSDSGGNLGNSCPSVTTLTTQTNGVNNTSQSTLNLINSSTNAAGLTLTETNTTAGNVQGEITGTANVSHGGTGQTTYTDGQLLIGNTSTNGLNKATITAGTGISVTNGNGTITIGTSGSGNGAGIVSSGASAVSLTGTIYVPFGGGGFSSSTEANVDLEAPTAATVGNFYVQLSAAPGAGNSIAVTIRKNGSDTSSTCTISGASAISCNDTVHSFSVAAADLMAIKLVPSGTIVATPNILTTVQWGATAALVQNQNAVSHNFLNAFNSSTGAFSTAQPAVGDLQNIAADSVLMNATGGSAAPTAVTMPTCTTGAVLYNTSTHVWSCVSVGGGSSALTNITSLVTFDNCTVTGNVCKFTGSSSTSITASSIPAGHNGLRIVMFGNNASAATVGDLTIRLNADSTTGHYAQEGWAQNGTGSIGQNANGNGGGCNVTGKWGSLTDRLTLDIPLYADTTFGKIVTIDSASFLQTTATTTNWALQEPCGFSPTGAITGFTVLLGSGTYNTGTYVVVYAID